MQCLLRGLIPFIPKEAVVVGTIVNSRLDYANALYLGLPKYQISRLQVVQNTSARLVTGKKPWESISPSLRTLHWLPVKDRIAFKALCLTHKCVQGNAPQYLCEKLKANNPNRVLRSTNQNLLQKPITSPKEKEDSRSRVQDYGTLYQPAFGWRKTTWPSEDRLKLCSFDVKRQEPSSTQKRLSSHVPRYISFSFIHSMGQ